MRYPAYFKNGNKFTPIPYEKMKTFEDGTRGFRGLGGGKKAWSYDTVYHHRKHFIRFYEWEHDRYRWVFMGHLSWWGRMKLRKEAIFSYWVYYAAAAMIIATLIVFGTLFYAAASLLWGSIHGG